MISKRRFLVLAILLGAGLAVALSRASRPAPFKLAPGWKLELVAQAPDILFPTAIVVAPDGAIYLAQDPMDMPGPPTVPADSVVAIKDGRITRFADGLNAVMGLEWVDDTLYVVHAPYLSAFRDTDGDGRADRRVDLVTGLGPRVPAFNGINDHIASGIRLGIDGYLYIAVGDKGIPRGVGADGTTIRLRGGGVIRVRPDGTSLEVVSTGERNPLSVALGPTDEIFTYGNDDDSKKWPNSLTHHIVGGHHGYPYEFRDAPERALPIVAGEVGGAGAQGICYNEDGLPDRFRGNLFFCDWGRGAVARYDVRRAGGTFRLNAREYIVRRGTIGDFRPFSLAVGDGGRCLYLVDWAFNGFLADGPRTGRLFRLTYAEGGRPEPARRPARDGLAALDHPALSVRLAAQRALAARGPDVESALKAKLQGDGPPVGRVHALWSLDALGTENARRAIRSVLGDAHIDVRSQAARSIGIRRDRESWPALAALLKDPDAVVRREAAIALGRIADPAAGPSLMEALGDRDAFADWAVRRAIRKLEAWDVGALRLALGQPSRRESARRLCDGSWALPVVEALVLAVGDCEEPAWRARVVETLAGLHRRDPEWSGGWWGPNPLAGAFPRRTLDWDPVGMAAVRRALISTLDDPDPSVRRQAILGLAGVGRPAIDALRRALGCERDSSNLVLIARALGDRGDEASAPALARRLADAGESLEVRLAALTALEALPASAAVQARLSLFREPGIPAPLIAGAIAGLARQRHLGMNDLCRLVDHRAEAIRAAALGAIVGRDTLDTSLRSRITARLDDPSIAVRTAAIDAAGSLRIGEAVPRLIQLAQEETYRMAATRALGTLADARALPVYLAAIEDRDAEMRRVGTDALAAIRDVAAAELESSLGSGRFAGPAALALERALTSFAPVTDWRIIGPFPRNAPRLFSDASAIDFARPSAAVEGRMVRWRSLVGAPRTGRVAIDELKLSAPVHPDLGYDPAGSADLAAYGYAELIADEDRPALLLVGSSGTITVYLNGEIALHADHSSGRPYAPDSDLVRIALRKGTNRILVRSREGIGRWSFSLQVSDSRSGLFAAAQALPVHPDLEEYALSHSGDARRGASLFFDRRGVGCARCHSAGGRGTATIGPDLTSLALKYDRAEIIGSVLKPSERIVNGYQPVVLSRTDGTVVTGLLRAETEADLELIDSDLNTMRVPKSEIEARRLGETSQMPAGLADALTPSEFADLIAFLQSLATAS